MGTNDFFFYLTLNECCYEMGDALEREERGVNGNRWTGAECLICQGQ